MLKIEGSLNLRFPDAIFFSICFPAGVMILIGLISGGKPAFEGAGYSLMESSFGALSTVGICATAFMGFPLTITDYREKKILKHFFVTPVSPAVILLVQGVIYMAFALVSSAVVFLVARLFFGYEMKGSVPGFLLSYVLVMASMYSLGMILASACKNIKTANVAANAVYFPMVLLSGATIPYEIFPKPLQAVANLLPLTQGIKLLKGYSLGLTQENLLLPVVVLAVFVVVGTAVSVKVFRWE
jgi:ABC-2 type transport system permease protein